MQNFNELQLPEALNHTLAHMKFEVPTPVQAQAIPPALEGKDILGSAQTGTGKTGAFGIPLVTKLMTSPKGSAMIITPTRELAVQVLEQIQSFLGKRSPIKTALLIGGESMPKQLQQLRARPRVFVGTPGRINDHLERGSLMLHDTNFLVLDETDRMLDMGFTVQIERILKFLPQTRQTLLFSATIPPNIAKVAQKYLKNPVRVSVGTDSTPAANITQEIIRVADADKYQELLSQLNERQGSILVFVKTKHGAERMATKLRKQKHSAEAIHGDLRQNRRDRVIADFRDCKYRILVATDIAARGLDIPHIEHVINYDLPQCPEDYIHRIGRTARAGAQGAAICLISPADKLKWNAIERLLDPSVKREKPSSGGGNGGGNKNRNRSRSRNNSSQNNGGGGKPPHQGGASKSGGSKEGASKDSRFKRRRRPAGSGNAGRQGNSGSSGQHKAA